MFMHQHLASVLANNAHLRSEDITALFGIRNPRRAIHYLRTRGQSIVSKEITRKRGKFNGKVEYSVSKSKK